jgi:hypothetical protein
VGVWAERLLALPAAVARKEQVAVSALVGEAHPLPAEEEVQPLAQVEAALLVLLASLLVRALSFLLSLLARLG